MSLLQNNLLKQVAGELAIYTAVDSIRSRELDFSDLPVNALSIVAYNVVVKNIVDGKLSGAIDPMVSHLIEDYVGRVGTLYLAGMFMNKNRDFKALTKDQLFYSLAVYLTYNSSSQLGLNKLVDPRLAPAQGSTYKA